MTWTTPQPTPATPHPALVPHRPLTLGEIAGGAWRVYKARFGLFVKLLLMPFLLMLGASLIFGLAMAGMLLSNPDAMQSGVMPPAFFGLFALFYVALLVISLLVYVYQGRTVVAGIDLATGRENPTSANLAARTRGMLGRVVVLLLLGFAASILVALVLAAAIVPIAASAGANDRAGAGAGLLTLILMPILYVALIWISIKLTYVIPAMAEEGLGGWDAIKRSFAVTKGAWWKTFGYQLVLVLLGMALMIVPYIIIMASAFGAANTGRGEMAGGALVGLVVGVILLYALLILFVPYQYLFTGLMYLSRTRELGAPVAAPQAYGAPFGQDGGQPYPPQEQPPYPPQGQQPYPPAPEQQRPENPWGQPPAPGGSAPQG